MRFYSDTTMCCYVMCGFTVKQVFSVCLYITVILQCVKHSVMWVFSVINVLSVLQYGFYSDTQNVVMQCGILQ